MRSALVGEDSQGIGGGLAGLAGHQECRCRRENRTPGTDREFGDTGADLDDHARAFAAEQRVVGGMPRVIACRGSS